MKSSFLILVLMGSSFTFADENNRPDVSTQASAAKISKGGIVPIFERSKIDSLVMEVKKSEQGMELLKPEFYTKAYSTEVRCDENKLFLLSDFDLSLPASLSQTDNRGFPLIGSGGHHLRIFLQDDKGNLKIVWSSVVIEILEFRTLGKCPDLIVQLHGLAFGRAGNAYGVGRLRFLNGKYSILMRDGKTVEEKVK